MPTISSKCARKHLVWGSPICLRCQLTLPNAQDARAQRADDTQSYDRHTQGTAAHVHALHLLLGPADAHSEPAGPRTKPVFPARLVDT